MLFEARFQPMPNMRLILHDDILSSLKSQIAFSIFFVVWKEEKKTPKKKKVEGKKQ
jgi:hypothetical protein